MYSFHQEPDDDTIIIQFDPLDNNDVDFQDILYSPKLCQVDTLDNDVSTSFVCYNELCLPKTNQAFHEAFTSLCCNNTKKHVTQEEDLFDKTVPVSRNNIPSNEKHEVKYESFCSVEIKPNMSDTSGYSDA